MIPRTPAPDGRAPWRVGLLKTIGAGTVLVGLLVAPAPSLRAQTLDLALEVASRSSLACAAEAPCGPVVLVVGGALELPSWCTGTVVGLDLVLTAAHCLPADLRHSGSSCAGSLAITWAEPLDAAPTACAEVVLATDPRPDAGAQDIALVRLARAAPGAVRPMPLSSDGLEDGLLISVLAAHGARNAGGGVHATLRSHACSLAHGSITFPSFDDAYSPVGLAVGCQQMVDGTSGSPVLGPDRRMRGVFHAAFEFRWIDSLWYWPDSLEGVLEAPRRPDPVAWITNVACGPSLLRSLGVPTDGSHRVCRSAMDADLRAQEELREQRGQRALEDLARARSASPGQPFWLTVGADRVPRVVPGRRAPLRLPVLGEPTH